MMTETTHQKTALVTGANRSIGFEIARRLAAEGYRVWLGSRDVGRGEEAAQKLRDQGLDVHVLQLDVTSDESVTLAITELSSQTNHLDALINNAGIADSFTHPALR